MGPRIRWTSDIESASPDSGHGQRPRLLLLCDYRLNEAATVRDHIEAIRRWSRNEVFILPMHGDIPDELDLEAFDGVAIHYNVVMSFAAYLSPLARWRISRFKGVKAAFVQDEYRFVNDTVGVMRSLGINVLFTCVPEDQVELVYPRERLPEMERKITVLTGYVSDALVSVPPLPYDARTIDVGYRGRRLPPWLGELAQEKAIIADRFAAESSRYGLVTDISCQEKDRLYGPAWIDFVSHSRAMLGVESGASVFDFDGSIERSVRLYLAAEPDAPFEDLRRRFFAEVEGRIRLNQISPRCFEAAALGTLMILYPGDYSGILHPWRHYVPLQKDHSNMDEVVHAIRDRQVWESITLRARDEIAQDRRYSFAAMVELVDAGLGLVAAPRSGIATEAFSEIANRSYRMLPGSRQREYGLPPAINRMRMLPGRVARQLKADPIGIAPLAGRQRETAHRLHELARLYRALVYWALRPRLVPWSELLRGGRGLLADLGELRRLQRLGARARKLACGSPYSLLLDEGAHELRVALRTDVPAGAIALRSVPVDLAWAQSIRLDLTDAWLAPSNDRERMRMRLETLSGMFRRHTEPGRRLIEGEAAWCDIWLARDSASN